ncbi:MAG TPA: retropepsin-like aspartic protease [Bacteroidia bacterium]|nr:retropepsin-like aspartic protease [Bacteroidia bacterium]
MLSGSIKIPLIIQTIEEDGFHLSVMAKINGKSVHLLVDTGASRTVFDKQRSLRYIGESSHEPHDKLSTGLGTSSMKTHLAVIRKIKIGELAIENFEAVLLDLSHVNESYEKMGLTPIDGVLGSDVLLKYKAVINYGKKELKFSFKSK